MAEVSVRLQLRFMIPLYYQLTLKPYIFRHKFSHSINDTMKYTILGLQVYDLGS